MQLAHHLPLQKAEIFVDGTVGQEFSEARELEKGYMEDEFTCDKSDRVGIDASTKRRRLMLDDMDKGRVLRPKYEAVTKVGWKSESSPRIDEDCRLMLRTACQLKEFRKTVSCLSEEKVVAINGMGFGPLQCIGSCKLNRELCQMLVEKFDVENCTLKIHGRDLCISDWDFYRLMGVCNGGTEVELEGSMEDPVMNQLMCRLGNDNNEITTIALRKIIEKGKEADDMFKLAFALYALATILCPTDPGIADPKFLIPLCDPGLISTKNWATFCFAQLLEGVSLYKKNRNESMRGCMLLLQLFYLDSVCYGSVLVPTSIKAVVGWTREKLDMLIKWIMSEGGFSSTRIFVMKRTVAIASRMNEKGDCYVCNAISLVKTEVCVIKADIGVLSSTIGCLETNLGGMVNTFREIGKSLDEMNVGSIKNIMEEVVKVLIGSSGQSSQFNVTSKEAVLKEFVGHKSMDNNGIEPEIRKSSPRPPVGYENCHEPEDKRVEAIDERKWKDQTMEDNVTPKYDPTCTKEQIYKMYVRKMTRKELELLKFLFSNAWMEASDNSKEEVARFGETGMSIWEIQSLLPKIHILPKVINMAAAYLFEKESTSWFFPTSFGECASSMNGNSPHGLSIPSMIVGSGLQRFHRLLKNCLEIFIPLHDDGAEHWFLLVIKVEEKIGEVWDSALESGQSRGRVAIARSTLALLQMVFANEMTTWRDVYYDFTTFKIVCPTPSQTNENNHDSGIYVIRQMQCNRQNCFDWINPEEQRRLIAVDLVLNPKNESIDKLIERALGPKSRNTAGLGTSKSKNQSKVRPNPEKEGGNVKSTEQVNGRKCRSHRKRRTRA